MRLSGLFSILASLLLFASCGTVKYVYVPVGNDTHVEQRDSIIYKTDTIKIDVPVEMIKEVVPALDTLYMETSVAKATAFLDTSTVSLKGVLENKKTTLSDVQAVYKEKISYRDSIQIKKEPYPVEVEKIVKVVPWPWKVMSVIGILALAYIAFKILWKLK